METPDKNHRASSLASPQQRCSDSIAIALVEGIQQFTASLAAMARKDGRWPAELILNRPPTEFDNIVIRWTIQHVANELDHQIDILWVP